MSRRMDGRETWHRLLDWDKGSTDAERLAAVVVSLCGYEAVDPSHPLGGRDGKKDAVCRKGAARFVVGCYFPRGQQKFTDIQAKFDLDYEGVEKNRADGFIFITNQELRLKERTALTDSKDRPVEILHLEAVSAILNRPIAYGVRLEFLDIDMTKEEQLAFISARDERLGRVEEGVNVLLKRTDPTAEREPAHVTPRLVNDFLGASLFQDTHHRCTKCGYGFVVKSNPYSAAAITTSPTLGFGQHVVTCPECGNSDPYRGPLG